MSPARPQRSTRTVSPAGGQLDRLLPEDADERELLDDELRDELDRDELDDERLELDELDDRELDELDDRELDDPDERELDEPDEFDERELDDAEPTLLDDELELLLVPGDDEPARLAWLTPVPSPLASIALGDVGPPPPQPMVAPLAVTSVAPPDRRIRKSRRLAGDWGVGTGGLPLLRGFDMPTPRDVAATQGRRRAPNGAQRA